MKQNILIIGGRGYLGSFLSDYLIKKHMYRDVNDEFVDSMPTPWDILVEMESFEIDIINFTQMINSYSSQKNTQ